MGTMRSSALALLAAAATVLAACGDSTLPTGPAAAAPSAPAREVSHWPTYGTPGFWFTYADPPAGYPVALFDATLSPTVEICRVTSGVCGPILATFTKTSGSYNRLVTVNTQDSAYQVVWPTSSTGAQSGQIYRVKVRVGSRALGFMDVKMVTSVADYFGTDTDVYYPWVAGLNLTVSFTIRQGIAGSFSGVPTSLALNLGEATTFNPTVLGLSGSTLAGADPGELFQTATTSGGDVAVLDSGLVVASAVGTGTLWTWYDDLMVSVPVTVTDNRRAWFDMTSPDPEALRGLWGSGTSDIYAASNAGILRYNGTAWSYQTPVRWRSMYDITGFSASNVWAVGDGGIIARYDGSSWTTLLYDGTTVSATPLNSFARPAKKIRLRGIWGSSASNVVVVGDSGTVLVYNGSTWSTRSSGVTAALTDVWGSSSTNFYATTVDGRIIRFNATTATVVSGVQAPGAFHAIWGSGASDIYAVGDGGIVYRFDGTNWTRIRLPTRAALYTVWGTASTNVYVAGSAGALYRWDGTKWNPEKRQGGAAAQYQALWGTGSNVYAAGGGGFISRR
jgi:hypothetical protein